MTSEYVSIAFPGQGDINRIGAQVISGVGFLGVGTIIITGKKHLRLQRDYGPVPVRVLRLGSDLSRER